MESAQGISCTSFTSIGIEHNHWIIRVQCVLDRHVSHFHCLCVSVMWKLYRKSSRRECYFWHEPSWNGFAIWKSGKGATCELYYHLTEASWGPTIVKISPLVSMFFTPVFSSDCTKQNRTTWESNIWKSEWTCVSVYSLPKKDVLCTVSTLRVCMFNTSQLTQNRWLMSCMLWIWCLSVRACMYILLCVANTVAILP